MRILALAALLAFLVPSSADAGLFSRLFGGRSCSSCKSCSKPAAKAPSACKKVDGKWVCPKK